MFDSKNSSPVGIAIVIALVTGILSMLIILLSRDGLVFSIVAFVAIFSTCFFLSRYLIERFIHRRIKLIYKFIHQTKASKREEFFQKNVLPQQSLDEVDEEVLKWADDRKAEMEVLEKNEAFRKEFLQNLSHEFKTPAFAIQGYLET